MVEVSFGHNLVSRADFALLSYKIECVTHEHLAENTLRRIWGKLQGYDTVFIRTLDVLCHYIGYDHWDSFCSALNKNSGVESEIIKGLNSIKIEDLAPGDKIRIGWLPNRMCIVEYMGGRTFKAVDCHNSTMQAGDSFECNVMLKNYPLFVDNLIHGGELCQRYSIGLESGLTTLEKL